jgi:hypothetical protein
VLLTTIASELINFELGDILSPAAMLFGADASGPTVIRWRPTRRNQGNGRLDEIGTTNAPLLGMYFGPLAASKAHTLQTFRRRQTSKFTAKFRSGRVEQIRRQPTITKNL